jgi:hypothetical protein
MDAEQKKMVITGKQKLKLIEAFEKRESGNKVSSKLLHQDRNCM